MLRLLGRMYAQAMRLRARVYASGRISSWRPPGACISVGNISWGGSGKTPLCAWVLDWGLRRGYRPALLTRGYRARPPHLPYMVQKDSPVAASGDEPLMLSRQCPQAMVVVDPKRSRGGRRAYELAQPDLFLLDDGFQHVGVERDVDLVLITEKDLGRDWNRVLPSGPWREGVSALHRASAFVLNVLPGQGLQMRRTLQARLGSEHQPVFSCHYHIQALRRVMDQGIVPAQGQECVLVSGVGHPQRVAQSASGYMARPPLAHCRYADHHAYTQGDWAHIARTAQEVHADLILCTQKDGVKLENLADHRLCVLDMSLRFDPPPPGVPSLEQWLTQRLQARG